MDAIIRFWGNVDKNGPTPECRPELGPCWLWTKSVQKTGYGQVGNDKLGMSGGKVIFTHRVAYELIKGPIPDGFEIDHLCGNRRCCNPDHLEAVTKRMNCERAGFFGKENPRNRMGDRGACCHGHEYTPENTHIAKDGSRACRTCARLAARKRALRLRGG
jgi:hypothetical protein